MKVKNRCSRTQINNLRKEIMVIKLHNYACELLHKMERGGRLQSFQKELVKAVLDPAEIDYVKSPKCQCCGTTLETWEEEKLDCGHVACNSCTYDRNDIYRCANCHEKLEASNNEK